MYLPYLPICKYFTRWEYYIDIEVSLYVYGILVEFSSSVWLSVLVVAVRELKLATFQS